MKFFINNVKVLFNYKIILIIAVCFIVNIFYSGEDFSSVIYGVKGSFNLNTAIPWLATVFPFFLATGAFISQRDDNKIFVLSRIKNLSRYYLDFISIIIFSALIYCAFFGIVSFVAGGLLQYILLCLLLLFFNLVFLATVQWSLYVLTKNTMVSTLAVLIIVVCALVFYKNNFNIGAWAMVARSNVMKSGGFNIFFVIICQTILTTILCVVLVFLNKFFKEKL